MLDYSIYLQIVWPPFCSCVSADLVRDSVLQEVDSKRLHDRELDLTAVAVVLECAEAYLMDGEVVEEEVERVRADRAIIWGILVAEIASEAYYRTPSEGSTVEVDSSARRRSMGLAVVPCTRVEEAFHVAAERATAHRNAIRDAVRVTKSQLVGGADHFDVL